jgi:hypothetical protein
VEHLIEAGRVLDQRHLQAAASHRDLFLPPKDGRDGAEARADGARRQMQRDANGSRGHRVVGIVRAGERQVEREALALGLQGYLALPVRAGA